MSYTAEQRWRFLDANADKVLAIFFDEGGVNPVDDVAEKAAICAHAAARCDIETAYAVAVVQAVEAEVGAVEGSEALDKFRYLQYFLGEEDCELTTLSESILAQNKVYRRVTEPLAKERGAKLAAAAAVRQQVRDEMHARMETARARIREIITRLLDEEAVLAGNTAQGEA